MAYCFRKMFFIDKNLKHVHMTFFSWTCDLLLINSRYLVFEVSEAVIQRSNRPEVFCEKGVPTNFAKFTWKHLCWSLVFNKVEDLQPATFLKRRLWHRCFPAYFAKFLRTPFYTEHLQWLLLKFISRQTKEILYVNTILVGN